MTTTRTASASLAALFAINLHNAGSDFRWEGTRGTSCPRNDAFPGLVAWLREAQDDTCAACGDALSGTVQVCHIVASRNGRGYVPGNLYVGHQACNVDDRDTFGDAVPLASLVRRDLVATEYPTRQTMLSYAAAAGQDAEVKAQRLARRTAALAAARGL